MWNWFRRTPAETSFPTPEWPPIQSLDSVDLAAKRPDGGVDLNIVASQPLDNSTATLDSIRQKLETYLSVVDVEEFLEEMGNPLPGKISIIITCDFPIHPEAMKVIEECRRLAAEQRVRLDVQKSP
jgi:hypothetical protein